MKVLISGRKYPRGQSWDEARAVCFLRYGFVCVACGGTGLDCDHVFPERFVRFYLKGKDPHDPNNLVAICKLSHGKKTGADRLLWKGPDFMGFRQRLILYGWKPKVFNLAFDHFHLRYPR